MGFEAGTKDKIKRKMMQIMRSKSTSIEVFGRQAMANDIRERQAIDTSMLLNRSLISRFKFTNDSATFQFGVKATDYTRKDPSTPNYRSDKAPSESPPGFSNKPLGTTVDAAIAVIWGIGPHARRGPRNFPRVAINKVISKYFGDVSKLKRK